MSTQQKFVLFQEEVPIVEETQILVVGGGPAGLAAAIAAARNGVKTMLVERTGTLGGMATIGLVGPFMTCYSSDEKTQLIRGIFDELIRRMEKKQGAIHPSKIPRNSPYGNFYVLGHHHITPFDPEVLKLIAFEMCEEAGVKLLLYSQFIKAVKKQNFPLVKAAIFATKSHLHAIAAEIFIDCTGDGDLAFDNGASMVKGRASDHKMQPSTLFFRVNNVNFQKYIDYVRKNFKPGERLFTKEIEKARKEIDYKVPKDFLSIFQSTREDEWILNATRIHNIDGTDSYDLTKGQIEGVKQVFIILDFLRRYVAGFENARIVTTAPQVGIRETRRLVGEYVLTHEDVIECRNFEDAIAYFAYPIDLHDPEGGGGEKLDKNEKTPKKNAYSIPYRSLLPREIDNLLVAGRCISADRPANGSLRVMPACFATGQAAGTAGALAIKNGVLPHELDVSLLQDTLREQGVYLENR